MKLFINFSEILGLDILDQANQWAGHLHDIVMNPQGDIYPKSTHLVLKRGSIKKEYALVSWDDVAYIEHDVRLKVPESQLNFQDKPPQCDFTLKRDILDQQIVDTDNHKVERVNDIHLLRVDNQLYAAHVDVGLRALVRRLEWTFAVDHIVKLFKPRAKYLTQEELVPWKNTQVLPKLGRLKSVVRRDLSKTKLSGLPPAALSEIMKDLDVFTRVSLFRSLENAMQVQAFSSMPLSFKQDLMERLEKSEVVHLLESMPLEETKNILKVLPKEKRHQFLRLMEKETSEKLRKLLGFS